MAVQPTPELAWAAELGPAAPFNVFVFDRFHASISDAQGRIAGGKLVELRGYTLGDHVGPCPGGSFVTWTLVGGDVVDFDGDKVHYGSVAFGSGKSKIVNVTDPLNIPVHRQLIAVVDFAAAQLYLSDSSKRLATLPANGTVTLQGSTLLLKAGLTNSNVPTWVFQVTSSQLQACRNLIIDVPQRSAVLVNVSGHDPELSDSGMDLKCFGFDDQAKASGQLLFNLHDARQFVAHNVHICGCVLAPAASAELYDGLMTGVLVAESYETPDAKRPFQFNWCKEWQAC